MSEKEDPYVYNKKGEIIGRRSKGGSGKLDVNVQVNTDKIQELIEKNKELEEKLEESVEVKVGKDILERTKKRAFDVGLGDLDIKTKDEFMKAVHDIRFLEKPENDDGDDGEGNTGEGKTGKGSAGVVPLTPAQYGKSTEQGYDSYEDLIDDLKAKSKSADRELAGEATAILNTLWDKTWKGRKAEPHMLNYEFKGRINPATGEEEPFKEQLNRLWRKSEVQRILDLQKAREKEKK